MKKKTFALLLAVVMVMSFAVGGTLAWLTDTTGEVKNTFTTSGIDIDLTETKTDFQMIPGHTIDKDPKVTVKADSEKCYVYVKAVKSENFDQYMEYKMDSSWTQGEGTGEGKNGVPTDVWFQIVGKNAEKDQYLTVIENNTVTVKSSVTNEMMTSAKNNNPTLTFIAYASQYMKNNTENFTPAEAWANVAPTA